MEDIKCKRLIATFREDNLLLEGPKNLEFHIDKDIAITIEQMGSRIITIVSKCEKSAQYLYDLLVELEKLLMIFDGRFICLKKLVFEESADESEEHLEEYASEIVAHRLSYYDSADFCDYVTDKLLDFETTINTKLFVDWQELLKELDIVHQMFLYSVSDSRISVDVKCAFLIELSEPLVEVVKANTNLYSHLDPGEIGTSLKMCIEALISTYGADIFSEELTANSNKFLKTIVNSRVRIMHIKRKQNGLHFNGVESVLYAQKMVVLYRLVILEILGIDAESYKEKLMLHIKTLNTWKGVQGDFLKKLK